MAKKKSNDELILELKKQVEEKREKIAKVRTFKSVTNCILELDGEKLNIRTLPKDYKIGNFHIDMWLTDLDNLLENLSIRDEEKELREMEAKLTELLSHDKKVELELSKIMDKLNK
jgi:hypothetical protein